MLKYERDKRNHSVFVPTHLSLCQLLLVDLLDLGAVGQQVA